MIPYHLKSLKLSVPKSHAQKSGLRSITPIDELDKKLNEIFSINMRKIVKETWNKRVKEYERKINSGDISDLIIALKELDTLDKSYSEKVLFESALNMLSSEYAVSSGMDNEKAKKIIIQLCRT